MASSPEQEIPQEIVKTATRHFAWWLAHPDHDDEDWVSAMRPALAAVLPDMQRPLLEEIAKRKNQVGYESHARLEAEVQVCRLERLIETQWKPIEIERDSLLEEIERLRETSKALAQIADRRKDERDARPDLTAEEIEELLALRGPDAFFAEDHAVWKSARAKLERSLDAHKP